MTTQTLTLKFPTDAEGCLTQECGHCHERFKVNQAAHDQLEFCPFCGKAPNEGDGFLTAAQNAHAISVVEEKVVEPLLQDFDDQLQGLSGEFITATTSHTPLRANASPVETEGDMPSMTTSKCCQFTVRHEPAQKVAFCGHCQGSV